jgi:hypothetical protein
MKSHISNEQPLLQTIAADQASNVANRLYVTDIAIPSYDEDHIPTDALGISHD